MPHTYCAHGCKTGYCSCKDETKYSMFRFPQDDEFKKKWLSAIPRDDWTVTDSTRVRSKHFDQNDFEVLSTDKREKRQKSRKSAELLRLRLRPSAIPHLFPYLESHYNIEIPLQRTTTSTTASARSEKKK